MFPIRQRYNFESKSQRHERATGYFGATSGPSTIYPFWSMHKPGDEWGCKCSLSSTDEEPTNNVFLQSELKLTPPSPELGGNPGTTAKIFSDDHPYIANAYKGAKKAVAELMREMGIVEEQIVEKKFKSGGVLQTPKKFRQNAVEEKMNVKGYTELAEKHGDHYKLLNVVNEHGRKSPDAYNIRTGLYSDMKIPNGKNGIQAAIKEASRQRVGEVYIRLEKEFSRRIIYDGVKAALQGGRASTIREIAIRFPNGEIRRYDADALRARITFRTTSIKAGL